jgi:hypothetical protein
MLTKLPYLKILKSNCPTPVIVNWSAKIYNYIHSTAARETGRLMEIMPQIKRNFPKMAT